MLEFREEADRLVTENAEEVDALNRWYSRLGCKWRTEDIIRALRGES